MAIGRTAIRRKSSAVLRWLSLSSSGPSPATAMPPHRVRNNVPMHNIGANFIFDVFANAFGPTSEVSPAEGTLPGIVNTSGWQHPPPAMELQRQGTTENATGPMSPVV